MKTTLTMKAFHASLPLCQNIAKMFKQMDPKSKTFYRKMGLLKYFGTEVKVTMQPTRKQFLIVGTLEIRQTFWFFIYLFTLHNKMDLQMMTGYYTNKMTHFRQLN